MRSYISRCTLFVISLFCLISGSTFANVIDDDQRSGGFFALIPYNTDLGTFNPADYPYNWNDFDDDVTYTLWPEGQWINGNSSNQPIYSAARTYVTSGGDGYLDADQTGELDIYIGKSVMRVGSNDPTIAAGGSQKIRIFSSGGSQIANDHYGAALEVSGSNNSIELWYGSYDSEEVNNDTTSNGNKNTVELQGITNAYFKNVSFHGGDIIKSWITGTGGTGLSLGLTGNGIAVIDNVIGKNANEITGGKANGGGGGTAFRLSGGSTFATNLYATAGEGDDGNISFTRDSGNANVTMNGGNAIQTTSANLSIHNGELTAKDGAVLIVQNAYDNYDWQVTLNASGGNGIIGGTGNGTVENLIIRAGDGGRMSMDDASTGRHTLTINGGDAYSGNFSGGTVDGNFYAGDGGKGLSFTAGSATIFINGGNAFNGTGSGRVVSGIYEAGHGGSADLITTTDDASTLLADGGVAYNGAGTIDDGIFRSGNGGIIKVVGTNSTTASANGGHGASATGLDITGGTFYGGSGGLIEIAKGTAEANGGHGLRLTSGDSSISGGSFYGGSGGIAYNNSDGTSSARAGVGIHVGSTANAEIIGGTFNSGSDGDSDDPSQRSYSQFAGWLEDAGNVVIASDPTFNGSLLVTNTTSLAIEGGDILGNIHFGGGTTGFKLSSDTAVRGMLIQEAGDVTADISTAAEGTHYKNLFIQSGSFTFANNQLTTAQNALFTLSGANSRLNLQQGGTLSSGTSVGVGYGQMSSGADLTVERGSLVQLNFNGITNGILDVTGNLDLSAGGNVRISGAATQPSGVLYFGQVSGNIDSPENIQTDLGWLTQSTFTHISNRLLRVDYNYRSLTNSSALATIDSERFTGINKAITNGQYFARINALGHKDGSALILYDETLAPDVADAALDNQNYIHRQINARTMEMRARGGFAHNTRRSHLPAPTGVAGPEHSKQSNTRGWVRGYGAFGSRDESGTFDAYETTHYGTVIGIDRQFGTLLLGVAGGYSSIKLDADSTYNSDATGHNGSFYASLGSRQNFLDLSISRAEHNVTTKNLLTTDTFGAASTSYHIGVGREWNITQHLTCTPIFAYQHTNYDQDGYRRDGLLPKQMKNYETSSDLISLGATFSTARQYEWFNQHLAMIPEFRFRWLHELSPDLDALAFDYVGVASGESGSIRLRSREENLIELGLGIDFWSWHLYAAKFEFDYDYLLGEEYTEHTFSGKVTLQF